MQGLVLDLRFNPGGLLTSAVEVSDLFLAKGRIVSTAGRNIEEKSWDAKAGEDFDDFPLAVLVNRYSASSSEIVAACLQDHQRAIVVGERTWGKGSVQNVVEMEGGKSALKLTTASYMRPSGKNIHRFPDAKEKDEWGVMPDEGYAVRFNDDELRNYLARRRMRDFIRRKPRQPATVVAANEAQPPEAEEASNAVDTPAPTSDPPSGDEKEAAQGGSNTDQGDKVPPADNETDKKATEKQAAGTKSAVESDADKQGSGKQDKAAEPGAEKEAADGSGEFVDRQLEKALEYIKKKLSEQAAE
jgi:carboxyl-terminal processing protease